MTAPVAVRLKASPEQPRFGAAGGNRTDMGRRLKIFEKALFWALALAAVWFAPSASYAATSASSDILSIDGANEAADTVDIGGLKPLAKPRREGASPVPRGNPLWAVPLSALTATQERPLFSASRRPPPRAVVAPVVDQLNVPVVQKAAEPERPPLALIGAVVGDNDAIAVFLDRTNQKIVRLRQGEMHAGWVLRSVLRREVTLQKDEQTEVLALQRQDGPGGAAGAPGVPGLAIPASSGDASYAPYVPRSTPKNGESDGL
jgi:general secretion pathway protein N